MRGKKPQEEQTEEGSLSQDGQACNRCHMYRTRSQFTGCTDGISDTHHNICKVCGSRRTSEQADTSQSGARSIFTEIQI